MHPPQQDGLLPVPCSRDARPAQHSPTGRNPLSDTRMGSGVEVIPGTTLVLVSGASPVSAGNGVVGRADPATASEAMASPSRLKIRSTRAGDGFPAASAHSPLSARGRRAGMSRMDAVRRPCRQRSSLRPPPSAGKHRQKRPTPGRAPLTLPGRATLIVQPRRFTLAVPSHPSVVPSQPAQFLFQLPVAGLGGVGTAVRGVGLDS